MGGPGVFLPIPKEALEGHSDPKTVWTPSDERSASRRTIYAVVKRSLTNPLLETLDLCDTARSTAKRTTTTVAPQALTLFNGEFVNQQAKYLADRLETRGRAGRGEADRPGVPAGAVPAADGPRGRTDAGVPGRSPAAAGRPASSSAGCCST